MKTQLYNFRQRRKDQQGSAVIVILAFLAIMVLLVAANTKTVNWLRAEVRLTDQRQTARLTASATNALSLVVSNPPPASSH